MSSFICFPDAQSAAQAASRLFKRRVEPFQDVPRDLSISVNLTEMKIGDFLESFDKVLAHMQAACHLAPGREYQCSHTSAHTHLNFIGQQSLLNSSFLIH